MATVKVKLLEHMGLNGIRYIKELSEMSGVSELVISDLIKGKRKGVRLETITRLCNTLNCSIGDLIEIKKE